MNKKRISAFFASLALFCQYVPTVPVPYAAATPAALSLNDFARQVQEMTCNNHALQTVSPRRAEQISLAEITEEFETARLIVKAAGGIRTYGAKRVAEGYRDLHILQYETPQQAYEAYKKYESNPVVEFVQPSHCIQLDPSEITAETADTKTGQYNSWGAKEIGTDEFIKKNLPDPIDCPVITVAVIDTGINTIPALFTDRILQGGINVSNSGNDTPQDDLGHGTHVTGTICELTPENVKILPIKVFDRDGKSTDEQIYVGMMYALEQGADILNMSFGGLGVSPLEVEAMHIADENNIIAVAAAGNNGDDAGYYYPGGIESCITVGAVNAAMERPSFSNTGKLLDVCAPGVNVVSYGEDSDNLKTLSGTSMATPHVTACCALLKTYNFDWTPRKVESLLCMNALDLGKAGFDDEYGWGLVNLSGFDEDRFVCKAPEFSIKSGNYGTPQTVCISVDAKDVDICYTLDGSEPNMQNGILYEEPIYVEQTTRIRAVAYHGNEECSVPVEMVCQINGQDVPNALKISGGMVTSYTGIRSTLTIPAYYDGVPVKEIGKAAFLANPYVEEVVLPDTTLIIGESAFAGCSSLKKISGKNIVQIGRCAFMDDSALENVEFSSGITYVGNQAFYNCAALKEFSAPIMETVWPQAFYGCTALKKVELPSVTRIDEKAFSNCTSLKTLDIDWTNVTTLGDRAMEGCSAWAGDVRLLNLHSLGSAVFSGDKSLMRFSLPEWFDSLPPATLAGCSGLRLLQLPGITALASSSLAVQSCRSDLIAEIPYEQIKFVGTNAFNGFRIGNGCDTISFDTLENMTSFGFSGVNAGMLEFPQVKEVPNSAFVDAHVLCAAFPSAEQLGNNSMKGCASVLLTDSVQEISETALPDEIYIVTQDEIPALGNVSVQYHLCGEPLILKTNTENCTAELGEPAYLCVLASGTDLQYRWYLEDTETGQKMIEGAKETEFYAPTDVAGEFAYVCEITDAAGNTDTVHFHVTVTPQEFAPEFWQADLWAMQCLDWKTEQLGCFYVEVEEENLYRLDSAGSTPIEGTLYDDAGQPVGTFHTGLNNVSLMETVLFPGHHYTITPRALWDGIVSLRIAEEDSSVGAAQPISGCTVLAKQIGTYKYGEMPPVEITVKDKNGVVLTEFEDYRIYFTTHNQTSIIGIFGIGRYEGYTEVRLDTYAKIPQDEPLPLSLDSEDDRAVFLFVPPSTGKYYYYGTPVEGYAQEAMQYFRTGTYAGGSRYVNVQTMCEIATDLDGREIIASSDRNFLSNGYYFSDTVELTAGQPYYFICTAESAAEFALVVSGEEPRSIKKAEITGKLFALYDAEYSYWPEITVTLDGEELTENTDYLTYVKDGDIAGTAILNVVGMGLYTGKLTRSMNISYQSKERGGITAELGETVIVNCAEQRMEPVWFVANAGKNEKEQVRYRVLLERASGVKMQYQLYYYNANNGQYSLMKPIDGVPDDYLLRNGEYCVLCSRQYPDAAASSRVSILIPHDLNTAVMQVENATYTGSEITAPLTLTDANGNLLLPNVDYTLTYPEGHTMFGTIPFTVHPTKRSYGSFSGSFDILVDLPEDAPVLEIGEHEVQVTLQNRLAVYKITPETDMEYLLGTSDSPDIVLRVFSPDAEMLEQAYGTGTQTVSFTVPAGETRYIMVKFNGTAREGTIHFRLETTLRMLEKCTATALPQIYTGERIEPQVIFTDGDYTLQEGIDYYLRYTADDVNIGTATANYIGMGSYYGVCDVEFSIIPQNFFELEDMDIVPLVSNRTYVASGDPDSTIMCCKYQAGLDSPMQLDIYESYCRLSVQRYGANGNYQDSMFIRRDGKMTFTLKAGETAYFLFSATDIASWNQSFKILLSDYSSEDYRLVEDKEEGITYRVFDNFGYAEAYRIDTKAKQVSLRYEIEGIPVQFFPEGLFADLPTDMTVLGYAYCPVAIYADKYPFAYLVPDSESTIAGDLNGDARCTPADLVLLARMLAESDSLPLLERLVRQADLNDDGYINLWDYKLLAQMIQI